MYLNVRDWPKAGSRKKFGTKDWTLNGVYDTEAAALKNYKRISEPGYVVKIVKMIRSPLKSGSTGASIIAARNAEEVRHAVFFRKT